MTAEQIEAMCAQVVAYGQCQSTREPAFTSPFPVKFAARPRCVMPKGHQGEHKWELPRAQDR